MILTETSLRSAAALLSAVPGLACELVEHSGRRLRCGEHGEAVMCAHRFHAAVAGGDLAFEREIGVPRDALTAVDIDGADHVTGLVQHAGARWFVSPLPAAITVATIRESGHVPAPLAALVRDDRDLGVSVVCVRGGMSADALDDAAVSAYAACLVTHLVATSSPSP